MSQRQNIFEYIKQPQASRQSHLDLSEPCLERGGGSHQHQGVLVSFLDTTFPTGYHIHLCHACNNHKCSNPKHLYWGTAKENLDDSGTVPKFIQAGQAALLKYRQEHGHNWKGKCQSESTRLKLSQLNKGKKVSPEHRAKNLLTLAKYRQSRCASS